VIGGRIRIEPQSPSSQPVLDFPLLKRRIDFLPKSNLERMFFSMLKDHFYGFTSQLAINIRKKISNRCINIWLEIW